MGVGDVARGAQIELPPIGLDDIAVNENVDQPVEPSLAEVEVSDHSLAYGDTILGITNMKNVQNLSNNKDFYVTSTVGSLVKPLTFYALFPLLLFVGMLIVVALELIDICPASLMLVSIFFVGGWLNPTEIPKVVDLRLLMLLGSSISFAGSLSKSGLALVIASKVTDTNVSPFNALILVYGVTLVITELISNNAAAAMMYPIAVGIADKLGVDFKPFAMCVLISSTAGFMSPIGYQTHVMVWGPGGYKFRDFLLFGIFPDLCYWFIGCGLISVFMPFKAI